MGLRLFTHFNLTVSSCSQYVISSIGRPTTYTYICASKNCCIIDIRDYKKGPLSSIANRIKTKIIRELPVIVKIKNISDCTTGKLL